MPAPRLAGKCRSSMDRESFRKYQARCLDARFALTRGEDEARYRFEKLALDTYDLCPAQTHLPFSIWPESGGNFLIGYGRPNWKTQLGVAVPEDLVLRWQQWNREYYGLRERNPRLELRDLIQKCSETDSSASWPMFPYEADILHWTINGEWESPPFKDHRKIIDEKFFLRLREVHRRCGGWLFKEKSGLVFLPDELALEKPLDFPRRKKRKG